MFDGADGDEIELKNTVHTAEVKTLLETERAKIVELPHLLNWSNRWIRSTVSRFVNRNDLNRSYIINCFMLYV